MNTNRGSNGISEGRIWTQIVVLLKASVFMGIKLNWPNPFEGNNTTI
jgi:hypothetical protein